MPSVAVTTMLIGLFAPTVRGIAPLELPDATDTLLTLMVALMSAAVGVTVIDEPAFETAAV